MGWITSEADPIFFLWGGTACRLWSASEAYWGASETYRGRVSHMQKRSAHAGRRGASIVAPAAEAHCVIRVIRKIAPSGKHRSLQTRARTKGRLFEEGGPAATRPLPGSAPGSHCVKYIGIVNIRLIYIISITDLILVVQKQS